MGLDEKLFGVLFKRAKALFGPSRTPPPPGSLPLDDLAPRLEVLAGLVAGHRVDLRRLQLPERFDAGTTSEENELIALARTLRTALALRHGLVWADESTRPLATLLAQPLLRASLEADLPGAVRVLDEADRIAKRTIVLFPPEPEGSPRPHPAHTLADELQIRVSTASQALRSARWPVPESWGLLPTPAQAKAALPEPPLQNGSGSTGTEREGRKRKVRHIDLGEEKLDENPITHSFEKVHTAEEYKGGKKRTDGEDELAEHADALDELDMNEVTRSGERAKSVYRAELEFEGSVGDVAGESFGDAVPYDEWDASAGKYRESWCAVRERILPGSAPNPAWSRDVLARHAPQLRAIRAEFSRLEQTRVWRGRQTDGPEIDEDALVDRHASLKSGHQPPERLYMNRRRHERDLAVHLVVDASLSTDAWVANRRVLDVARESLVVLGEALREERIPTAVAVFRSHTRRDCRFELAKDFREDWDAAAPRLSGLTPEGYTRIGPALRHATHRLLENGARRKLLVLVSDGKPTDYDRYEGRHGIADIAKAVDEAHRADVLVHALAIDAVARAHLPRMFGRAGYEILPRPDVLPRALASLFTLLAS